MEEEPRREAGLLLHLVNIANISATASKSNSVAKNAFGIIQIQRYWTLAFGAFYGAL